MKKIILFISIFSAGSFASAQTHVNLGVRVSNPNNNSKIKPLEAFTSQVVITNLGPDNFSANDSFAMYIAEEYLGKKDTVWFYINSKLSQFKPFASTFLQVGDSTQLSIVNIFDTSFLGKVINHCISIQPLNRVTNLPKDTLQNNNVSCVTIEIEKSTNIAKVRFSDTEVRLSPNPASTFFKVNTKEIIESIWVQDMQGRVFEVINGKDEVDCSEWPVGLYILRVKCNGSLHFVKLLKG